MWLEKHKADLEDQIGFRLNIIGACDNGILAEIKDFRELMYLFHLGIWLKLKDS
ncbi:MAG: hypothetical protein AB1782_02550 [Cyanobacteriota bacterium]